MKIGQSEEYIKIDTGIKTFLLLIVKEKLFTTLVKDRKTIQQGTIVIVIRTSAMGSRSKGERLDSTPNTISKSKNL